MPKLELHLLGAPQWLLDGVPLQGFVTRKAEALLIYLAMNRQAHPRDALAAFFWPEIAEAHAKNNLRRTLSNLRQLIGSHLIIDRHTIDFDTQASYWLDVEAFSRSLSPLHTAPQAVATTKKLEDALALYQGDFLAGFLVRDAPRFDEWARIQREQLHGLAIQGLEQLTELYSQQHAYEAGLATTQRLLTLEPWHEPAHQQRMRLFWLTGRPAKALAQFERCRKILREELGIAPQPETVNLYQQIKAGHLDAHRQTHLLQPAVTGVLNGVTSGATNGATATTALPDHTRRHGTSLRSDILPIPLYLNGGKAGTVAAPPVAPRHNLPHQFTPFFGREEEIAELTARLRQPTCHLLTLFGEGGVGKTRLALALGQRIFDSMVGAAPDNPKLVVEPSKIESPKFPDGIWYVSLADFQPTADLAERLATAIGQAMGFVFKPGGALSTQLFAYLANKTALLILDNFEELVTGGDFLLALLQQSPTVKLLVTSRQILDLQAEVVWSVTGLPTPAPDTDAHVAKPLDLVALLRYPAIALFVERAQRVARTFQLAADNWQDVVAICHLSEGLPLAIELAAAQVKMRSCAAIRQTLAKQATAITVTYRDLPSRHRSLGIVLEDSWRLLTAEERAVLAATAIFVGGFTLEAANAIAGATLTISERLSDKAMLHHDSRYRFHLHPFVQQFAQAQLQHLGPAQVATVATNHGRYYLTLVHGQEQGLRGAAPQTAIALIQQELLNIERAWQWAVTQQAVTLLAQSSQALLEFHNRTNLFTQGTQQVAAAVAMVQQQLATVATAAEPETTGRPTVEELESHLATLLCALAYSLVSQNDPAASIETVQQALTLADKWALSQVAARGAYVWGLALFELADHAVAAQKLSQALGLARTAAMTDLRILALLRLGNLERVRGDQAKALVYAQEALQLSDVHQRPADKQYALMLLGTIYEYRGEFLQAKVYYEEALPLAETGNLYINQGDLLTNLGVVHDKLGHYGAAQRYYQTALRHYRRIGHRRGQAQVLGNLGISADYLGDYAAALRYSQECLQLFQSLGMMNECPTVLVNLALHAHHAGDHNLAQSYGRQALTISQESDNRHMQIYAWTVLGHAALGLDEPEAAATAYTNAITLAHELAIPFMTIEPLAGLVRVALAAGALTTQIQRSLESLLALVEEHGVAGLEEPFRVYLTCYEGLQALGDPRAAQLLQTAYGQLQTRAGQIDDEDLRHAFLTDVAANRALAQAATASLCSL